MNHSIQTSKHLESIKTQLKSEFIGLDDIIDQFIDAVTPWCVMRDSQTRPLVVNLWGMTGVGKTSLVKRFLELWDKNERVINFNLGSKSYFNDIMYHMQDMDYMSNHPCVIIFDEFQHAKTLENGSKEIENPIDRMIWQILDDGKYLYSNGHFDAEELQEMIVNLDLCLKNGVKIKKGKITKGWATYQSFNQITTESRNFFTERDVNYIYRLVRPEFKFKAEFRDFLFQMDGKELLEFLKKTEKKTTIDRNLNLSKSLIFVIGNLDEAFELSREMSADYDPDYFHNETKKITFSKIKDGLSERFRMEEIARLGNIHLIYPAFNSDFFKNFIEKELMEISHRFKKTFGFTTTFNESVKDMIFEEGVTPSQGFRPLRSSIRYLIESSVTNLVTQTTIQQGSHVLVDMEGEALILMVDDKIEAKKPLYLPVREAKRKKMTPQKTAVTAAHEAGHALVYAVMNGKLPNMVTIATSNYNDGGFIAGESNAEFESYETVIRDAAIKMAGKKAEELVFGTDQDISFGCQTDIAMATRILMDTIRSGGISGKDAFFENPIHSRGWHLPETTTETDWVQEKLEYAANLAKKVLEENLESYCCFVKVILEKKTLKGEELAEALVEAGVSVHHLLTYYPPLKNYAATLENFVHVNSKFAQIQ